MLISELPVLHRRVLPFAAWLFCVTVGGAAAAGDRRSAAPVVGRPAARLLGCSTTEAVCFHLAQGTKAAEASVARAMATAERTLAFLRRQGLPAPVEDGGLGGGPELDVYFAPTRQGARAYPDAPSVVGVYERASAFVTLPNDRSGCELDSEVARAVAAAVLVGLDPDAHESTVAIGASQLASVVAPCPTLEFAAVDRVQRAPERSLARARADEFAGEALWADYLDETYGRGIPLRLFTDLVAISGTRATSVALDLPPDPDVFDVLRRTFTGLGSSLEDGLLGFAVARAFVGSRSDGAHLVDSARYGDLGRIRFDWSVTLGTLPRRLRTRVLEATGATYVWLDTAGATEKDGVTLVAECEHTHAFRWAMVTVDAEGKEVGRHIGGRFGEHTTQVSLENLAGVAGVVVVGVTSGHDDRNHPFDPDEGEPSEAVCEVTLHRK